MKRYENLIPRATFGIAAIAMTALTISLSVVIPAKVDSRADSATLAAAKVREAIEANIVPARIDVFGVRNPKIISMQPAAVRPNANQQG